MTGMPKSRASAATVVAPAAGGWSVQAGGGKTASVHETRTGAVEAARDQLRTAGGALQVQDADGRIRETLTLGRAAIARINAVEGLSPPQGLAEDLAEFDRLDLSPEERRNRVAKAYGGKPR